MDGRTDGRTDGWMDSTGPPPPLPPPASTTTTTSPRARGRGARQGGQEVAAGPGGQRRGAPCPQPGRGPWQPPRPPPNWGGLVGVFLVFFFFFSLPSARLPGVFFLPDGCRWVFGRADPHQALAASPAGLGDATIARLPTSHSTLGPAPPDPSQPPEQRGEEGATAGGVHRPPSPPASPAGPRLGRGAGAAFSLLPARSRGTL